MPKSTFSIAVSRPSNSMLTVKNTSVEIEKKTKKKSPSPVSRSTQKRGQNQSRMSQNLTSENTLQNNSQQTYKKSRKKSVSKQATQLSNPVILSAQVSGAKASKKKRKVSGLPQTQSPPFSA